MSVCVVFHSRGQYRAQRKISLVCDKLTALLLSCPPLEMLHLYILLKIKKSPLFQFGLILKCVTNPEDNVLQRSLPEDTVVREDDSSDSAKKNPHTDGDSALFQCFQLFLKLKFGPSTFSCGSAHCELWNDQ